jgi:hypothetical protein
MSSPAPEQQPAESPLLLLAAAQADALLALEQNAVRSAAGPLATELAAIGRQARGRFLMAQASGQPAAIDAARAWTVQQLQDAAVTYLDPAVVEPVLHHAAAAGTAAGARHAAEQAAVQAAPQDTAPAVAQKAVQAMAHAAAAAAPPTPAAPPVTAPVARSARAAAAARIDQAVTALADADNLTDVQTAVAQAQRAPEALATAAQWLTHYAAGESTRAEAIRRGAHLLWIAERNACVVCLALAGQTANVMEGEAFDEFATFGPDRPPAPWPPSAPLTGPPRHPHCRCQTVLWFGSAPGQPSLPASLIHEARRSILRGFSRPSESHRLRLVAAARLLDTGAHDMPKSVRQYAAHAVAAGHFPTREVPRYPARRRTP